MYSVTVINSSGEYVLHNTYDEDFKLEQPVLSLELNKSGTLTFGISPDHPNRAQILPMASEIYVYDDDTVYWIGRPLSIEGDFDMVASVTCEGILGYLLDTQVPPFDFTGNNSIRGSACVQYFLTRLINSHNARLTTGWADQRKRFAIGNVTVMDSNANLARSSEDYKSTLETINEKLINTHGGFLRVRLSGTTRYIDYIETFGAATQAITFGENLLDLNTHTNAGEVYTVVIPEGAEIEGTDTRVNLNSYSPTTAVKNQISTYTHGGAKINLASASSFSGYGAIYDAAGVATHGRVYLHKVWDDVTLPQNLALKAAQYIGAVSVLGTKIELSAVDLSRISVDYKRFNVGEVAQVISIPHGINAEYQISQMQVDLFNPANSTMVLGGDLGTFTFENTKKTAELSNAITDTIPEAIQTATALLSGGLGGYLIIRQDSNGQPYEILIMNAATESAATRCVRINQNGIGFGTSSTGSTSWTYRNAWTIDGNLVADFINTGTLKDTNGNMSWNLSTGAISAKKLSINSTNFVLDVNGNITAKNATLTGANVTGTVTTKTGSYKTVLSSGRLYSYYNDAIVGNVGGTYNSSGKRGMHLAIGSSGDFVSITDKNLVQRLTYTASAWGSIPANTLFAGCNLNMNGHTITGIGDGITGKFNTVRVTGVDSSGKLSGWVNGCYLQFRNGILIDMAT